MAPFRLLALLLTLLVAGCAADADDARGGGGGGSGGTGPDWPDAVPGGPLAGAGADQQVLEGMAVRLDGRGSLPAEDGTPLSYLWTQEAGPRVALDDPNSPLAWFVAPAIRPLDGSRLVFLLTVDDGRRRSRDRVVVELVDHPGDIELAPVAVGGADREVLAGSTVSLGPIRTLDPACIAAGGAPGCEETALPFRWTQVEGPAVELLEPTSVEARFVAPAWESVLTFRLDAQRPAAADETAGCGAGGNAAPSVLCSAPDYVRFFVKREGRLDGAPSASLFEPAPVAPGGGILRVGPGLAPAELAANLAVKVIGDESDPERNPIVDFGYRPLLGEVPLLDLDLRRSLFLDPRVGVTHPSPRMIGVSYETQAGRLHSAPVPVVISWEQADRGARPPVADAGADPCYSSPICVPFVGGDEVILDGSGSSDPDTAPGELTYCWEQTLGPPVAFTEGESCIVGNPTRTFVAPEAPAGAALELAFVLTVSDGGPLASVPDTAVVRVRPRNNAPPEVVLDGPGEANERTRVRFDASRSSDADGDRLSFSWRQIRGPGVPEVAIEPAWDCAEEAGPGACVELETPSVFADQPLEFELSVLDSRGVSSTQRFTLLVHNSENEPPSVDAGEDRLAAPGAQVELTGSAIDPNPDDVATLTWSWQVVSGGVTLESGDGPTVRFTAPEVTSDREVVLQLEVRDESGAVGSDQVVVSVLAEGPYASPDGDDASTGSRLAPVATITRALALAAQHGFPTIHLANGDFTAPAASVAGVRLRGGYDAAGDWRWPSDGLTRIGGSLTLGDGAILEQLAVAGGVIVSGEAATLERMQVEGNGSAAVQLSAGSLRVDGCTLVGAADRDAVGLSCDGPALLEIDDSQLVGGSGAGRHAAARIAGSCSASIESSTLVGSVGGNASDSVGLVAGGDTRVVNAVILGGAAPNSEAVRASAPVELHSSLLWIPAGSGARATSLSLAPGASATLRNLILGAGDAGDRAQIRDEGGGLPSVLERVLFTSDAACGGSAALVRTASGAFCSAASIRTLQTGWDPLVGDPAFVDAAAGDFHLAAASAAVDAGTATDAPATDLEGNARGVDGNGDGTPGPDIGPFERSN